MRMVNALVVPERSPPPAIAINHRIAQHALSDGFVRMHSLHTHDYLQASSFNDLLRNLVNAPKRMAHCRIGKIACAEESERSESRDRSDEENALLPASGFLHYGGHQLREERLTG